MFFPFKSLTVLNVDERCKFEYSGRPHSRGNTPFYPWQWYNMAITLDAVLWPMATTAHKLSAAATSFGSNCSLREHRNHQMHPGDPGSQSISLRIVGIWDSTAYFLSKTLSRGTKPAHSAWPCSATPFRCDDLGPLTTSMHGAWAPTLGLLSFLWSHGDCPEMRWLHGSHSPAARLPLNKRNRSVRGWGLNTHLLQLPFTAIRHITSSPAGRVSLRVRWPNQQLGT